MLKLPCRREQLNEIGRRDVNLVIGRVRLLMAIDVELADVRPSTWVVEVESRLFAIRVGEEADFLEDEVF